MNYSITYCFRFCSSLSRKRLHLRGREALLQAAGRGLDLDRGGREERHPQPQPPDASREHRAGK